MSTIVKNKKIIIFSITIFLLSFIIRVALKNNGLWHHDSVQLAIAVEDFVKNFDFHGISGGKHGLVFIYSFFYIIPYYFFQIPTSELSITIATIFFSSLAIIMFFLLTNFLIKNEFVAFFVSLLFSLSPIVLASTTYANSHGLDMFIVLNSFYLLCVALKYNSRISALWSSVLLGFSLFIRPSNFILILPYFFMIVLKNYVYAKKKPEAIKRATPYTIYPFLFILIIFLMLNIKSFIDLASYNKYLGISNFMLFGIKDIIFTLTIVGTIFTVLGLLYLTVIKSYKKYFLLAWFIPMFFYHANVLSYTPRFLVTTIIPLFVFLGFGLSLMYKFNKHVCVVIAIVIAALMLHAIYPVISFRHQYSGVKDYSLFIKNHTEDNAVIIVFGDDAPFLAYYANRTAMNCNYNNKADVEKSLLYIHELLEKNISVYASESCALRTMYSFTGSFYNALFKFFNSSKIGEALYEDYHKNDLKLRLNNASLKRLILLTRFD